MMGGSIGMKSFCCAVLGGMASIGGAAVGGLLIGIAENLGIMVLSAGFRDIVSFVFLILILLVKPEGLFVKKGR
jgi:branched-chain amino acid transport system permease protein